MLRGLARGSGVSLVGGRVGVWLVARRRLGRVAGALRGASAARAGAAVTAVAAAAEYCEEDGDDDHDRCHAGDEEDAAGGRLLLLGLTGAFVVLGTTAGVRGRGSRGLGQGALLGTLGDVH